MKIKNQISKIKNLTVKIVIGVFLLFAGHWLLSAKETSKSIFWRGKANQKMVCLTFDDGPDPEITPKILKILQDYNLKATFFMLGCNAGTYPQIVRLVDDAGQDIGNHTYQHLNFYTYKRADKEEKLTQEIERTSLVIKKIIGKAVRWVRLPYGYNKQWARELAADQGYVFLTWTFGCDWNKMTADQLIEAYLKNAQNGAIFLLHDGKKHYKTIEALPKIIEGLQKKGFKIVTLQEIYESLEK
ncbi:MAG: polysaccharide deacetylase family protein [Elusimicrobiota bacterium]